MLGAVDEVPRPAWGVRGLAHRLPAGVRELREANLG